MKIHGKSSSVLVPEVQHVLITARDPEPGNPAELTALGEVAFPRPVHFSFLSASWSFPSPPACVWNAPHMPSSCDRLRSLYHPPFAGQTPEFHTPVILQLLETNAAALRTAREGKEKQRQGWHGPHLQKPSGCVRKDGCERKDGRVRSSARLKGQRGSVCLWHASTHPPLSQTQHADV